MQTILADLSSNPRISFHICQKKNCISISVNKPCSFHAASAVKNEADAIAARYDACDSVFLNISDNPDYLDELVKGSDVVVSLLPYALHAKVARSCIANKVRRKNSKKLM